MAKRKYNGYGVPIFSESETKLLRKILVSVPCKPCGAKVGKPCKDLKPGCVHMGRLPAGFDSLKAVNAAKRSKK